MKKIFIRIIILFVGIVLIKCKGIDDKVESIEPKGASISFVYSQQGEIIKNIFSDVNVWDLEHWFREDKYVPDDYFATNFPAIKTVQFMCATGGNARRERVNAPRDLFLHPNNSKTFTDYDFKKFLKVMYAVVRQGLKPMIKTGAVPIKYSKNPKIGPFWTNTRPPYDYDLYYNYIKALADTCVKEFGLDEVKTWSWGVLTEYENGSWFHAESDNPDSTKIAYFKLYDYTVAALQASIGAENLIVGAHSMTCSPGLWDECEFIDHVSKGINYKTGKIGTQINFLTASYYETQPGEILGKHNLSLEKTIGLLQKRALANGLTNLKFGVDEGRILNDKHGTSLYNTHIFALSFQAAQDAKLFTRMNNLNADWFSTWLLTTEDFWEGVPLVGTHIANLTSKMAGDKRMKMMSEGSLKDSLNEIGGIGGYNPQENKIHLLLYNCNKDVYQLYPEREDINICLKNVTPLKGSKVMVTEWMVDDTHGNFWPTWYRDKKKRGLTNDDFIFSEYAPNVPRDMRNTEDKKYWYSRENIYKEKARLVPVQKKMKVKDGELVLQPSIQHNGVIFYEIENVKMDNP